MFRLPKLQLILVPKIISIGKYLFKLQLKMSGVFFLRHTVVHLETTVTDVDTGRYVLQVFMLVGVSYTQQSDQQVNRYKWLEFLKPCNCRALPSIVLCGMNQTGQINLNCQHLTSSNNSVTLINVTHMCDNYSILTITHFSCTYLYICMYLSAKKLLKRN